MKSDEQEEAARDSVDDCTEEPTNNMQEAIRRNGLLSTRLETKKNPVQDQACTETKTYEEDFCCIDCMPKGLNELNWRHGLPLPLHSAGVSDTESWDAVKRTNTHSKFAGVKRHECLQGHDSPNSGYEAKREMIPRSHRGAFIPVMRTKE